MKKYFKSVITVLCVILYLYLFPQQIVAAAGNTIIQVTCDNQAPNNIGTNKNGYHNVGGAAYQAYCPHMEDACVNKPGNMVSETPNPGTCGKFQTNCQVTYTEYVGVACQDSAICGCSADGKSIQCYAPINGKPAQYDPNDKASQPQAFTCGSGTSCEKKPGVNDNGFSYLDQQISGVACVSQCTCDHPNKAGNGNNGWTCKGGGTGSCPNREDYCSNTPSGTLSVSCVDNSKCTCSADKTQINCTSVGSGDGGANENQSFSCNGAACISGAGVNDPAFMFANQHISGIECKPNNPTEPPPPPSPPCMQWNANGICETFNSAFGGFSTNPAAFIQNIFAILLSVSGGIALLLIMRAGYSLMTAQGNPEKLTNGREQLIAAIVGLIFLIFSFVFLELIGFDILHLPGFNAAGGAAQGTGVTAQSCNAAGEQYCPTIKQCYPQSSTCP